MQKAFKIVGIVFIILIMLSMLPNLFKTYKKEYSSFMKPKTRVGVICIGEIVAETGKYTKYLKEYFEDKSIKAILLKIDSPGGAAGSSEAIFNEIIELKKANPKPVVAYTQNLCASGGYMIACATDYIVATPSSIVGSIGAYIGGWKLKEFIEQWKVGYKLHKAGDYKTILNPFTDSTEKEDQLLNDLSANVYEHFTSLVAKARNLSLNELDKWANGKVFTGSMAKEIGLVDELGSEFNAIKKLKELAIIDGDIEFVKPKKPTMLEQMFNPNADDCQAGLNILERAITNVLKEQIGAKL